LFYELEVRVNWNTQISWNTLCLAKLKGKALFLNDVAKKVFVPNKTSLKINGAEGQPRQPLVVFQLNRLFQFTHCSNLSVLPIV
jgi:hypothetical protein